MEIKLAVFTLHMVVKCKMTGHVVAVIIHQDSNDTPSLSNLLYGISVIAPYIGSNTNEEEAKALLAQYNEEAQVEYAKATEAAWAYYTNITAHNQQKSVS